MAKDTKDRLKQGLLVLFVVACIVIISLVWQSSLGTQGGSAASPGATLAPTPTSLESIPSTRVNLQVQVLDHLTHRISEPTSGGELHWVGGNQL